MTQARRAGALYFLILLNAPFNNIYIASTFFVPGNAAATAHNILASTLMYRAGIVSGLLGQVLFLFLASSLHELLRDVDRRQARLMVLLVATGACVALVNLINQMAPLVVLGGERFLSGFTETQLASLVLMFVGLRNSGNDLAMAFWALWLFPFGLLVIRSGFLPKLLGVLLIVGGVAYLVLSFISIVWPAYSRDASRLLLPFYAIGELATIFWLLLKGARTPALRPEAAR